MKMLCKLFFVALIGTATAYAVAGYPPAIQYPRAQMLPEQSEPDFDEAQEDNPQWLRRQLAKIGEYASRATNAFGSTAVKITGYVDKVCQFVKKVVPVVGAICSVAQFQFCSMDMNIPAETTGQIYLTQRSIAPVNLDEQDK